MKCKINKSLFEEGEAMSAAASAYATTTNTVGIGDPVPAGTSSLGSGDKFDNQFKMATKKAAPKKPKKRIKLNKVKKES